VAAGEELGGMALQLIVFHDATVLFGGMVCCQMKDVV
jgi:hypothetical protein